MLKPHRTLRKETHELLALQNRPFEGLPELSFMLPVNYQLQNSLDALVDIHQGLDDLIIKQLSPTIANKTILIPSHYEQLLIHATANLFNISQQADNPIYGHCAKLLRTEALQIKFIHSKKNKHSTNANEGIKPPASQPNLNEDQFSTLQIIAFIFLRHRKYNKAGVILKTLIHIKFNNDNTRFSLAFILSELGLVDEAEEVLSHLPDDNETNSSLLDLLRTKINLVQNQSKLESNHHQKDELSN